MLSPPPWLVGLLQAAAWPVCLQSYFGLDCSLFLKNLRRSHLFWKTVLSLFSSLAFKNIYSLKNPTLLVVLLLFNELKESYPPIVWVLHLLMSSSDLWYTISSMEERLRRQIAASCCISVILLKIKAIKDLQIFGGRSPRIGWTTYIGFPCVNV